MTTEKKFPPVIGLELVGRGVKLRPRQSYELKEVIFERYFNKTFRSIETKQTYAVPDGYEINESPPTPTNKALGKIIVEDSWENFEANFHLDVQIAASWDAFSVDVQTEQIKKLRSENASYYAVRTSFIPFWALYIPDVTGLYGKQKLKKAIKKLPTPFQYQERREYEKFFEQYGTHYIKRAWVGGKAMLVFAIAKSAKLKETQIRQSINASYVLSGDLNENQKQNKKELQSSSECTVLGQGGEQVKLGALSSLDLESYNAWLGTIKDCPKVIEFEAVGIWTLIDDKDKAKALSKAYEVAFTSFSTIISYNNKEIYFLKGREYTYYNITIGQTIGPKPINQKWPSLSKIEGFESVDAALKGYYAKSFSGTRLKDKLFFFKEDQCICLDINSNKIDEGYPRRIVDEWPGVKFERIDAALSVDQESVYFFMENEYIRFNLKENKADPGYPKKISDEWDGITFDRIDAAFAWDGKAYFFNGNEYICYDMIKYRVDSGYPKIIASGYVEDWKLFGDAIQKLNDSS